MKSFALPAWTVLCILVPLCSGRATVTERIIRDTRLLAQTIISRVQELNNQFKPSPSLVISGLDLIPEPLKENNVENLGTVDEALGCFIESLSTLQMDNSMQVQTDVKNLKVLVKSLATSFGCSSSRCEKAHHLKRFLRRNSAFIFTIRHVVLDRLQKYLNRLLRTLDNPRSCRAS
ncbi:leptin a [Scyliorhinus canicula]|uniref:leptin a n=1 Tax=Scyliorhinus canicula TaxID=7830 RepID=UPI0018F788E3|nr:leptin a [Scyliorhinus canicula]XP_038667989.1 leptin a [Scyliorhinus canicula]